MQNYIKSQTRLAFVQYIFQNEFISTDSLESIEDFQKHFSETSEKKSIFKKKIKYSYVFVFKIDDNEQIVETKVYNIKNIKNIKIVDQKTSNEIVRRGLLEKVFGGVGTQQELPTTP